MQGVEIQFGRKGDDRTESGHPVDDAGRSTSEDPLQLLTEFRGAEWFCITTTSVASQQCTNPPDL